LRWQGKVVVGVKDEGVSRHQEKREAHKGAIYAAILVDDSIYTAARDKTLRKWKPRKNDQNGHVELDQELEIKLPSAVWCVLYIGQWLFCGLGNGLIKGFCKDGTEAELTGHTMKVSQIIVHSDVLISGSSDGTVRLWQKHPEQNQFGCSHVIKEGITGWVTCLRVLQLHLWVGTTTGLSVVNLESLAVVGKLLPDKYVTGFEVFQDHLIAVCQDGSAGIWDANGQEKLIQNPLKAGPMSCVCVKGDRLVFGHSKGQLSCMSLPDFTFKKEFPVLDRIKVRFLCPIENSPYFVLGGDNGNLQVWEKGDPAAMAANANGTGPGVMVQG